MFRNMMFVLIFMVGCVTTLPSSEILIDKQEPIEKLAEEVKHLDKQRVREVASLAGAVFLGGTFTAGGLPVADDPVALSLYGNVGLRLTVGADIGLFTAGFLGGASLNGGGMAIGGKSAFAWRLGRNRTYLGPIIMAEYEVGSALNDAYRWRGAMGLAFFGEPDGNVRYPGSYRLEVALCPMVSQVALARESFHPGILLLVGATYDLMTWDNEDLSVPEDTR